MDEQPGPLSPHAVVFDVGEVLIDETRVWSTWASLIGVSPLTFASVLGAAIVQGEDHTSVFPHLAPNLDWEPLEDEHERLFQGFKESDLYHDARQVLKELTNDGLLVVIAGNQPARRQAQLEALNLDARVIATSHGLGAEKPHPDFWDAVEELCSPVARERILYVGDRIDNDIEPAMLSGFLTCWLQRGPWGQLQELPDDVHPDLVLEGLGELPRIIRDWRDEESNSEADK